MTYFDGAKAQRELDNFNNYKKLKEDIKSSFNNNGELKEYYPALDHITTMELKIEKQEKELKEYREFFAKLKSFLPREFTIYDRIG